MELDRAIHQWIAHERAGQLERADAAFRTVFQIMPCHAPQATLVDRVMLAAGKRAVSMPTRSSTGRLRWLRAAAAVAVSLVSVALGSLGLVLFLPSLARQLARVLEFGASVSIWVLQQVDAGLNAWAILARAGRTVALVFATPQASGALVGLELVAAVALYTLHHLLAAERESTS